MRAKTVLIKLIAAATLVFASLAQAASVSNVRLWPAPDHVRLVFDISGPVKHKAFTLEHPHRVVVDIDDAILSANLRQIDLKDSPITKVRSGVRDGSSLRVVLEVARATKIRSFLLKPNGQYGDRLVVDLLTGSGDGPATTLATAPAKTPVPAKSPDQTVKKTVSSNRAQRDIIVVIDAGHGGEDPGALGPNRIREKDVVLAIARELQGMLRYEKGFSGQLTRTGDYYIGLRQRTKLARKHNADLFISIHADAFNRPEAAGASVFAISQRGATSETARWLAERENSADLIGGVGGVSLDDKDDVLAGVLLDLSMTASLNASLSVGSHVLRSMGKVAKLHKPRVEQAGFMVLKSPDIPSLLVETGFISNPVEAQRLNTQKYQRMIAKSIHQGIQSYFEDTPPPGTYLAYKKHGGAPLMASVDTQLMESGSSSSTAYVISRGDTLSGIAQKNNVSITKLREINGLSSDNVRIGQVIQIPSS